MAGRGWALVARPPRLDGRLLLLVADANALTSQDAAIRDALIAADNQVEVFSQQLTQAERNAIGEKRHPLRPMETTVYAIAPSVTDLACIRAHDYVMAPVITFGSTVAEELNLNVGDRIDAGQALSLRNELDPPAWMLPGGVPLATGKRSALASNASAAVITSSIAWINGSTDPNNQAPQIQAGPSASEMLVTDQDTVVSVNASDPDGDALSYSWDATGSAPVTFAAGQASTTATFQAAGVYQIKVTVSDGRGGAVTSSPALQVEVSQTATTLEISP
jgi:hypothetical protein